MQENLQKLRDNAAALNDAKATDEDMRGDRHADKRRKSEGGTAAGEAKSQTSQPDFWEPEGRGRGRGKGGGRGRKGGGKPSSSSKGTGKGAATTVEEALEQHRQMLVRLAADKREEARFKAWVWEIPTGEGNPGATAVRDALEQGAKDWQATRPDRGKHPAGEKFEILWALFADAMSALVRQTESTDQQRQAKAQLDWFKSTFRGEKGQQTSIRQFHPLGRRDRQPAGPWYWSFRIDDTFSQGRDANEDLFKFKEDEWPSGVLLRRDRGTMDQLERALQTQLRIG